MAHKTLVGGAGYEIAGGKDLVGGTAYSKKKGRTLVGGTEYDIPFSKGIVPIYTGEYNLYGTPEQGWIEMLTSGTLTIESNLPCDIYLLGGGCYGKSSEFVYATPNSFPVYGGDGGAGGKYYELFGMNLKGSHTVTIFSSTSYGWANDHATTLDTYSSASGVRASSGGTGAKITGYSYQNATGTRPTAGGNGRQPFTGHTPMSQGFAAQKLGAGGGGGGFEQQLQTYEWAGGSGGTYGGGNARPGVTEAAARGKKNTGGGGGGGVYTVWDRSSGRHYGGDEGSCGIAIVRWGY